MKSFVDKISNSKFGLFWKKAHLTYLVLGFLLLGIKALLYFGIAAIAKTGAIQVVQFNMAIDDAIPFIPYFYLFYVTYYFLPEIFLWILSFFNKRKSIDLFFGVVITNILCCVCFLIVNVQMRRAPYEALVAPYTLFDGHFTNFKEFCYALVNLHYHADAGAYNCFPSLHASFATMLMLIGIPLSKNEKHFPIGCRIVCIVFGAGIWMSTFFIKQHYFIDAVTGMLLVIGSYYLAHFLIDKYLKHKEKKQLKNG